MKLILPNDVDQRPCSLDTYGSLQRLCLGPLQEWGESEQMPIANESDEPYRHKRGCLAGMP